MLELPSPGGTKHCPYIHICTYTTETCIPIIYWYSVQTNRFLTISRGSNVLLVGCLQAFMCTVDTMYMYGTLYLISMPHLHNIHTRIANTQGT